MLSPDKALIHLWSYRYNSLAEMLQRGIVFLAIGFFLGMGTIDPQHENISHFRRLFAMHVGVTPGAIRQATAIQSRA